MRNQEPQFHYNNNQIKKTQLYKLHKFRRSIEYKDDTFFPNWGRVEKTVIDQAIVV